MLKKIITVLLSLALIGSSTVTSSAAYSAYSLVFKGDVNHSGAYDATTRWYSPLATPNGSQSYLTVSSKLGEPRAVASNNTSPHTGVDLAAPDGTRVIAVQAGTATPQRDSFNTLVLSNGKAGVPYCHYEHMYSRFVKTGSCAKGDLLGYTSNTGSGQYHLHFGAYDTSTLTGRRAYRTETFYRNAAAWNYGRDLDVFSNSQWNVGNVAKITVVFTGANRANTEVPAEVRIYYRSGTQTWTNGGVMTRGSNFTYSYKLPSSKYPSGTTVQWMVRIKRNIRSVSYPYTWAPAKYYRPSTNPNSNAYTYACFSNVMY